MSKVHRWLSFGTVTLLLFALESGQVCAGAMRLLKAQCEDQNQPVGIGSSPRFGWVLKSDHRAASQSAYHLQVASSAALLAQSQPDLWDSGQVASSQSTLLPYAGKPLQSHTWYFWRVRVWDQTGQVSGWSDIHSCATGVLHPEEWQGQWLAGRRGARHEDAPSFWFRRTFELQQGQPGPALCSIASAGYHELYVNGRKVGEDVMAPAISDLHQRVLYVTRDLAPYLRRGTNVIGVWLGQGWVDHTGKSWSRKGQPDWPPNPRFLLEAQIQDGPRALRLASTTDWKCHQANTDSHFPPAQRFLGGELQDDRAYLPGWNRPEYEDCEWSPAIAQKSALYISPQGVECNRIIERLPAVAVREIKPGVYQADLGRQFSGWIELQAKGPPGSRVEISLSEHPDQPITYGQQNALILGPTGQGTFRNHFKHQSGRWVTVQGLSAPLQAAQIQGYAISTGYERTGQFACSNDLYNRIYQAVGWTFRQISLGGYVVDCPHRERLGYGDSINTVESAMLAFDTELFFTKWSRDWSDVQQADGNVPFTAPTYTGGGGPMWSSTLVHLPWLAYVYYGDPSAMEENYPAIRRWMRFLEANCQSNVLQWVAGPTNSISAQWSFLGDWVYPGHQQRPNGHDRETLFMNNCYYLHTLRTAARVAQAVGQGDDALHFQAQAQAVAAAVHQQFWDPQARSYPGDRQTTPASALFAGLPPEPIRPLVEAQLEQRIRAKRHLDTGILGTYFLLEALTAADRADLADCIANTEESPGWGAMLAQGATCIWEQWDGRNSRCHSSFLSIGAWFVKGILGIRPDPAQPGFRHFLVKPGLYETLTYASGECQTGYGRIACSWKRQDGQFVLNLEVPVNTTATLFLPAHDAATLTESGKPLSQAQGVRFLRLENRRAVLEVGSGTYRFGTTLPGGRP